MNSRQASGFTIVEVVLVIAIGGLVLIGVLAGLSASINEARYKTATTGVVDFFQGQYERLSATANSSRSGSLRDTEHCASASTSSRGQSDCVLVGVVVRDSADGVGGSYVLQSNPVYATTPPQVAGNQDDVAVLQKSGLIEDQTGQSSQSYTMDWGSGLVMPSEKTKQQHVSMLIARSPTSGAVHTFTLTGSASSVSTIKVADLASEARRTNNSVFCVEMPGYRSSLGVKVAADSATASGVVLATESEGACS